MKLLAFSIFIAAIILMVAAGAHCALSKQLECTYNVLGGSLIVTPNQEFWSKIGLGADT